MALFQNKEKEVSGSERRKLEDLVKITRQHEEEYRTLSDTELRAKTDEFKRFIKQKEDEATREGNELKTTPVFEFMPEAFAVVNETIDRRLGIWDKVILNPNFDLSKLDVFLGDYQQKVLDIRAQLKFDERKDSKAEIQKMREEATNIMLESNFYTTLRNLTTNVKFRPFDCQVMGAVELAEGKIAEMKTGEGKTIVATMPLYLHALSGKGAHLATVNPYLARHGRNWMAPVYKALGMKVGLVTSENDMLDYDEGLKEVKGKIKSTEDIVSKLGFDHQKFIEFGSQYFGFRGLLKQIQDNLETFVPSYHIQNTVAELKQMGLFEKMFGERQLPLEAVVQYRKEGDKLTQTQKDNFKKIISILDDYDSTGNLDAQGFKSAEQALFNESREISSRFGEMSNFDNIVANIRNLAGTLFNFANSSQSIKSIKELLDQNVELRNSIKGYVQEKKREAYNSDITYFDVSERSFDYLRDNLHKSLGDMIQQDKFYYCLIDEVDSILIDEARNPFIISTPDPNSQPLASQAQNIYKKANFDFDFNLDKDQKRVELSDSGKAKLRRIIGENNVSVPIGEIEQFLSTIILSREYAKENAEYGNMITRRMNLLKDEEQFDQKDELFFFIYKQGNDSKYHIGSRGNRLVEEYVKASGIDIKAKDASKTAVDLINLVQKEKAGILTQQDFEALAREKIAQLNGKRFKDDKLKDMIVSIASRLFIENHSLELILSQAQSEMKSDYFLDHARNKVQIRDSGFDKIVDLLNSEYNVDKQEVYDGDHVIMLEAVQTAISVNNFNIQGKSYDIVDGEIIIVNEKTGRLEPGKRYSKGVHSAIEAKHESEGVKVKPLTKNSAEVSHQSFFKLYHGLAGMSGTAKTDENELKEHYSLPVVVIPTNKPCIRIDKEDKVFMNKEGKYSQLVLDVVANHDIGRPILIGTGSINSSVEISDRLSAEGIQKYAVAALFSAKVKASKLKENEQLRLVNNLYLTLNKMNAEACVNIGSSLGIDCSLSNPENFNLLKEILNYKGEDSALKETLEKGVEHNVLNARNHTQEAAIIANAGKKGAVTVATNMAGRGVDILLGGADNAYDPKFHDEVNKLGGLYVIATERHESRRIDNQLRGRAARQGDNGESVFYISYEDDLLENEAKPRIIMRRMFYDTPVEHRWITKGVGKVQQRVQSNFLASRTYMLKMDNVMQTQRNVVYKEREDILKAADLNPYTTSILEELVETVSKEGVEKLDGEYTNLDRVKNFFISAPIFYKGPNGVDMEALIGFLKNTMPLETYLKVKDGEQVTEEHITSAIKLFLEEYSHRIKDNKNCLGMYIALNDIVPIQNFISAREFYDSVEKGGFEKSKDKLINKLLDSYEGLESKANKSELDDFTRKMLLDAIDNQWTVHLDNISDLKETLSFRTMMAQSFKESAEGVFSKDAHALYEQFKTEVRKAYAGNLFKYLTQQEQRKQLEQEQSKTEEKKLITEIH